MSKEEVLRIAWKLANIRKQKGITQQQLADMIGVKQSEIARLEQGDRNFGIERLEQICTALGVTIEFRASE